MVKIRLMRVGKRKQPSYRVVVADSRSPRDGRIIEAIGRYNPRNEPSEVEINSDRAVHWLQRGAQPSGAVQKLLQITGAWYAFTGERPPAGAPATTGAAPKATPAESIKATPAASIDEESDESPPAEGAGGPSQPDETPPAEGAAGQRQPDEARQTASSEAKSEAQTDASDEAPA